MMVKSWASGPGNVGSDLGLTSYQLYIQMDA